MIATTTTESPVVGRLFLVVEDVAICVCTLFLRRYIYQQTTNNNSTNNSLHISHMKDGHSSFHWLPLAGSRQREFPSRGTSNLLSGLYIVIVVELHSVIVSKEFPRIRCCQACDRTWVLEWEQIAWRIIWLRSKWRLSYQAKSHRWFI